MMLVLALRQGKATLGPLAEGLARYLTSGILTRWVLTDARRYAASALHGGGAAAWNSHGRNGGRFMYIAV